MDLARLGVLKDKLIHAKDLSEVINYFLDHFGSSPEFISLGERTGHAFLEAVIAEVGRQLFGRPVAPAEVLLTRLTEKRFIHGGCTVNGCIGTILFFEDVAVGLLALAGPPLMGETKLARFTGKPLGPPALGKPSVN